MPSRSSQRSHLAHRKAAPGTPPPGVRIGDPLFAVEGASPFGATTPGPVLRQDRLRYGAFPPRSGRHFASPASGFRQRRAQYFAQAEGLLTHPKSGAPGSGSGVGESGGGSQSFGTWTTGRGFTSGPPSVPGPLTAWSRSVSWFSSSCLRLPHPDPSLPPAPPILSQDQLQMQTADGPTSKLPIPRRPPPGPTPLWTPKTATHRVLRRASSAQENRRPTNYLFKRKKDRNPEIHPSLTRRLALSYMGTNLLSQL